MRHSKVVVPWQEGLHLRHALTLVKIGKFFRSSIVLRSGHKLADLRSIISIIALCATMGTALDVEVCGDDEADATRAIEQAFSGQNHPVPCSNNMRQG